MPTMKARTWRGASTEGLAAVKALLSQVGASEDSNIKSSHEAWRLRLGGSVFTAYKKGTVFCNGGDAPELEFLYGKIAEALGQVRDVPSAQFLIGLDETGKGEVLGHSALAAVRVRQSSLANLDSAVSTIDTKSRKGFAFWDGALRDIDALRGRGVEYLVETVPPWDVDRYNINKILDVVYQRLLTRILAGIDAGQTRIVIDDYGVGRNLEDYLEALQAAGAEVRVETKADTRYPEVRAASIVAKWRRELAMKGIGERYLLPNHPVGSGNAGDPTTKSWLTAWKATGQAWPWFVKRSFRTIREIDGRGQALPKEDPPIRHELLSPESSDRFREGRLSTSSLSIVCPSCGVVSSGAKLTPAPDGRGLTGRCIGCGEVIRDLETTLRYYCGLVLPDTSVIVAGTLSKDLDQRGFFGGFTIILPTVVGRESDAPGGRSELAKLADFAAMGRISMVAVESSVAGTSAERDSVVIRCAKDTDSILVTRDGGMYGSAAAHHVFCLTFKTNVERAEPTGG